MMKRISSLIIVFTVLIACNDRNADKELELEILSEEFISYSGDEYHFFSDEYLAKYVTKYTYKLKNNSGKKYVFNLDRYSEFVNGKGKYFNEKEFLVFISEKGDSAKVFTRLHSAKEYKCFDNYLNFVNTNLKSDVVNSQMLVASKFNNFIINPKETVYFENFVILPLGDEFNTFGVQLFNDKKYFIELSIWSDTTYINQIYNKSELKTFKENNYEFYHGVVNSKNKVPLKLMN
jgi:hypothetical protein